MAAVGIGKAHRANIGNVESAIGLLTDRPVDRQTSSDTMTRVAKIACLVLGVLSAVAMGLAGWLYATAHDEPLETPMLSSADGAPVIDQNPLVAAAPIVEPAQRAVRKLMQVVLPAAAVALGRIANQTVQQEAPVYLPLGNVSILSGLPPHLQATSEMKILGTQRTDSSCRDVSVNGPLACVADLANGAHLVDVSNSASPRRLGNIPTPNVAYGTYITGDSRFCLVAASGHGLYISSLANVANPQVVGTVALPGNAYAVTAEGSMGFVSLNEAGIASVDFTVFTKPKAQQILPTSGPAYQVALGYNHIACVAATTHGVDLVDRTNPASMHIAKNIPLPQGSAEGVLYTDNYCIVAGGTGGVYVIGNVDTPEQASIVGHTTVADLNASGVALSKDGILYVSSHGSTLEAFDLTDKTEPRHLASLKLADDARRVTISEGQLYVADSLVGLDIVSPAHSAISGLVDPEAKPGDYTVHAQATNPITGEEDFTFNFKVTPVIEQTTPFTKEIAQVGQHYELSVARFVQRRGLDLDYAVFTKDGSPLPAWIVYNAKEGILQGFPTETDQGILDLVVVATDPLGAESQRVDCTIHIGNIPLLTTSVPQQRVQVETKFTFSLGDQLFVSDRPLTYKAVINDYQRSDLPAWLQFDSEHLTFSGTPDKASEAKKLNLLIVATTDYGLEQTAAFELDVLAPQAPTIEQLVPDLVAHFGGGNGLDYTLPEGVFGHPFETPKVSLENAPDWVHFDPTTRKVTGKPSLWDLLFRNVRNMAFKGTNRHEQSVELPASVFITSTSTWALALFGGIATVSIYITYKLRRFICFCCFKKKPTEPHSIQGVHDLDFGN